MSDTPKTDAVRRRYPDAPLVGVAAVVFDAVGRVLLVQRGRPPGKGRWGLPGGLLDLGERLADGARREVREECGIDVEIVEMVAAYEPIVYDETGRIEYHYVVVDYWARYLDGLATAQDDADAVAWLALDQLSQVDIAAETLEVIHKAHRAWEGRHSESAA